jgi:aspartate/tyrosine/aromatic aminotransferase
MDSVAANTHLDAWRLELHRPGKGTVRVSQQDGHSRFTICRIQCSLISNYSVLPLSPEICRELTDKHHIYIVPNGRTNISGLNEQSVARFCELVDAALRWPMTSMSNGTNGVNGR